jgi:hypothetical protein
MNNEVPALSVGASESPQLLWQTDDSPANMLACFSVFSHQ